MNEMWPVVGDCSEPVEMVVEVGAVKNFVRALGGNPADYLACEVAPPTFATVFRLIAKIPSVERIPQAALLHGEEEYVYARPLRIGDVITCVARVVDVYEREGRSGRLRFVVIEYEGCDERERRVFLGRTVGVVREEARLK